MKMKKKKRKMKKMTRSILGIILCMAMLLGLAGCGANDSPGNEADEMCIRDRSDPGKTGSAGRRQVL